MTRSQLKSLVNQGLSTSLIAAKVGISQTSVRRELNRHGLKTIFRKYNSGTVKRCLCIKCGQSDNKMFYGKEKTYCKKCRSKYVLEAGRRLRAKATEQLGGKCIICGFNKYLCSLDFHHISPKHKDPHFGSKRGWSWDRMKRELEKCVLLCKNCHAAVHSDILRLPG